MKVTKPKTETKKQLPPVKKKEAEKKKELEYVEIKVICTDCGKESRIVVLEGTDTSEYLCPKCSVGDFVDEEEDFG